MGGAWIPPPLGRSVFKGTLRAPPPPPPPPRPAPSPAGGGKRPCTEQHLLWGQNSHTCCLWFYSYGNTRGLDRFLLNPRQRALPVHFLRPSLACQTRIGNAQTAHGEYSCLTKGRQQPVQTAGAIIQCG